MKRNVILVIVCVVLGGAAVFLSRRDLKPAPPSGARVVVTPGGQVTVVPPENHFKATIVADFPKTNAPANTSPPK